VVRVVSEGSGAIFATYQLLFDHRERRDDAVRMSGELFDVVARGAVTIPLHGRLALSDAAEAHRRLEARETTGSTILIP